MEVPNSSYPEQARQTVGLDLGPSCLQRLTTDGTSMVKNKNVNTVL